MVLSDDPAPLPVRGPAWADALRPLGWLALYLVWVVVARLLAGAL
jgi:hypothetical protein